MAADTKLAAFDRQVHKDNLEPDGRFRAPLSSESRQIAALDRNALQCFEPGMRYSERAVNGLLACFPDDTAAILRAIVTLGLLDRTAHKAAQWLDDAG